MSAIITYFFSTSITSGHDHVLLLHSPAIFFCLHPPTSLILRTHAPLKPCTDLCLPQPGKETPGDDPENPLHYFLANTLVLFSTRFPYLENSCKFSNIFSSSPRIFGKPPRQDTGVVQLVIEAKPRSKRSIWGPNLTFPITIKKKQK